MTPALIIADPARPAAWRRLVALMEIYRGVGLAPQLLSVTDGDLGSACVDRILDLDPTAGFLRSWAAAREGARLAFAQGAALVHADRAIDPGPWIGIADQVLSAQIEGDLTLVHSEEDAERARGAALIAPLLLSSARPVDRIRSASPLAGIWVADDVAAAEAVLARLHEERATIRVALAGPAAEAVRRPIESGAALMPAGTAEDNFYRGVDILIAPSAGQAQPRMELIEALRLGAAPLVVEGALSGLSDHWRLPQFRAPGEIAAYLGQKRGGLTGGGTLAELRARADWTWSGLSAAAARQRERLAARIRAMLQDKRAEKRSA